MAYPDVLESPIDSPGQVAALLSASFPSISEVYNHDGYRFECGEVENTTDRDKLWTKFEKLVGMFAAVRAEERARWNESVQGNQLHD